MPFQMIVQHAFTERLADGGFRIRNASDLVADPDQVAALEGNPHVVRIWVDDPAPTQSAPTPKLPQGKLASSDVQAQTDPAAAPAKQ